MTPRHSVCPPEAGWGNPYGSADNRDHIQPLRRPSGCLMLLRESPSLRSTVCALGRLALGGDFPYRVLGEVTRVVGGAHHRHVHAGPESEPVPGWLRVMETIGRHTPSVKSAPQLAHSKYHGAYCQDGAAADQHRHPGACAATGLTMSMTVPINPRHQATSVSPRP
jgi:hypothetical protein